MLQERIGYRFRNAALFRKAMTHSSYANEQRMRHLQNNERLEFLGDSVLGFVTADYLYNQFPDLPEGQLTKLRAAVVCEHALYEIAKDLGIDKEICLGHGEEQGGGRQRPRGRGACGCGPGGATARSCRAPAGPRPRAGVCGFAAGWAQPSLEQMAMEAFMEGAMAISAVT